MTLDASIIGIADEPYAIDVDPERLRAFAEAIGEGRAPYLDRAAARKAGRPDIPVPPTYHFTLGRTRDRLVEVLEERGVDPLRLLHGEQAFRYAAMAHAGDRLTVERRICDYFEKKSGALKFAVTETVIRRGGDLVSLSHETIVIPADLPQAAAAPFVPSAASDAVLPALRPDPPTRQTLARFASASGDMNPVHLEPVAARSAGYDDVFAHGMLSMAWLGRLLTDNHRQDAIRSFAVRFLTLTPIERQPICEGTRNGKAVSLRVFLEDGPATLVGRATID